MASTGDSVKAPTRTKIAFVVASTPRSGTAFMAKAISDAGIHCGHEEYFTPWHQIVADSQRRGIFGDSSWCAAPFLRALPSDVAVVHLMRNPVETINSLLATHHVGERNVYADFLSRHAGLRATIGATGLAQELWLAWHEMISKAAEGRRYRRVTVESMDGPAIRELCAWLGAGSVRIADPPPSDTNSRGRVPRAIGQGQLTPRAISLASEFGYADPLT